MMVVIIRLVHCLQQSTLPHINVVTGVNSLSGRVSTNQLDPTTFGVHGHPGGQPRNIVGRLGQRHGSVELCRPAHEWGRIWNHHLRVGLSSWNPSVTGGPENNTGPLNVCFLANVITVAVAVVVVVAAAVVVVTA